jgi:hypothetical protein
MNAAAVLNELVILSGLSLGAIVGAMVFMHWRIERNYMPRDMRWPKKIRRWWKR